MDAFLKAPLVAFLAADNVGQLPTLIPYLKKPCFVFLQSELTCFAYHRALTNTETACQFLIQGGWEMATQVVEHVRTPIDAGRVALMYHDTPHLWVVEYSVFRFLIHSFIL